MLRKILRGKKTQQCLSVKLHYLVLKTRSERWCKSTTTIRNPCLANQPPSLYVAALLVETIYAFPLVRVDGLWRQTREGARVVATYKYLY